MARARLAPGVPGRPRGSRSPDSHGRAGQAFEEEDGGRENDCVRGGVSVRDTKPFSRSPPVRGHACRETVNAGAPWPSAPTARRLLVGHGGDGDVRGRAARLWMSLCRGRSAPATLAKRGRVSLRGCGWGSVARRAPGPAGPRPGSCRSQPGTRRSTRRPAELLDSPRKAWPPRLAHTMPYVNT
jgi:hypothetical protein